MHKCCQHQHEATHHTATLHFVANPTTLLGLACRVKIWLKLSMDIPAEKIHPATAWAREMTFDATQVDCTITVVLKILDNKCKMLPGEKAAVMCIYDVVKLQPGKIFDDEAHATISKARTQLDDATKDKVHKLRVYAEANIPKPVMKAYKAVLRDGLFG